MFRHPRTRTLPVVLVLGLVVILAACAAAGAAPGDKTQERTGSAGTFGSLPDNPPVAQPPAPGTSDGKGGDVTGGTSDIAALAMRQIVKNGEITIEVSSVATATGQVRALAVELGGYVGSSQIGAIGPTPSPIYPVQDAPPVSVPDKAESVPGSATLTLRIPADRFDEAITRLHQLAGTVVAEATSEDDVTSQVVDIQARLANLQASEVQYRALLEKATKIEDILAVQARLDDVRGQIEQWQAQSKQLSELSTLATLTVTLSSTPIDQATSGWDPGKTVADALAALVTAGQQIVNGIIWFAIVWLPGLVGLAILLWLLWRVLPGLRRRIGRPSGGVASDALPAPTEQE
jgi:Domain of unknown function (DUF4349)